jgi:hypothetical protein
MAILHTKPMLYHFNEITPTKSMANICRNNGLGFIDGIIESTITESPEEYNLELIVDSSCVLFNDFQKMSLILADSQLFRIQEIIYSGEDNTKEIFAKHISYDLEHDVVINKKYEKKNFETIAKGMTSLSQFKQFSISYNLGRLKSRTLEKFESSDNSIQEEMESLIEDFIEDCAEAGIDAHIEVKRDNYSIGYYLYEPNVDYTNSTYKDSQGCGRQTGIRLNQKKIKNLEITESLEDFATRVSIKGKDDVLVSNITHDTIGNAGYPFWINTVISNTDISDKTKLTKIAKAHIALKSLSIKNIKVELEELPKSLREMFKDVRLYDKVLIQHNLISSLYVPFRIVKTERDVYGELISVELGELNSEFAKSLKKVIKNISAKIVQQKLNG